MTRNPRAITLMREVFLATVNESGLGFVLCNYNDGYDYDYVKDLYQVYENNNNKLHTYTYYDPTITKRERCTHTIINSCCNQFNRSSVEVGCHWLVK